MIIDEKVTITWNNKHKAYYESKGYIFTKKFEEFEVSTLDLAKSSNVRVNVKCDYCGTIYNVQNRFDYCYNYSYNLGLAFPVQPPNVPKNMAAQHKI